MLDLLWTRRRSGQVRVTVPAVLSLCYRELFSPSQKYQLLVYHADSLFHDKEYRNAVSKYTMALQQKKALSKTSKVRPATGNSAATPQSQVIGDGIV